MPQCCVKWLSRCPIGHSPMCAGPRRWWRPLRMRSCASVNLQNGFAPSASGRQENPYELERSYMNISLEPTVLDGNAAAGLLQQIFAVEVTTARVTCAACESVQPLASLMLYGLPMGYILCCPRCH